MPLRAAHTIHAAHCHFGWDNFFVLVMTVAPDDIVEFEILDALDGQLSPTSGVEDVTNSDFGRINPATAPVSRHFDEKDDVVTIGIGSDLMEATKHAVRQMVDLVRSRHGMSPVDAYILCSVCADLRISEIVDQPNWVVLFHFPSIVFD
jgi:acetamidase/formamidase